MTVDPGALYELLPAYHRRRDTELGRPLEALFEIFAREGARVEADLDEFSDALFVETCAELLLPRIGALVGAETLRPLPQEAGLSMRAFIGNVLRYRRAKGTAAALELLASDVTGYPAKAVEYFRLLSVTQTARSPRPERPATATIRDPDGRARHGGAFDKNPRTPDMRSIASAGGRYNIPNVGLHVWRLDAVPYTGPDGPKATAEALSGVPLAIPWDAHAGHYALLPQGRAVALFQPPSGLDGGWSLEQQIPAPLRRLPLFVELDGWRAAIARGTGSAYERQWFTPTREPFTVYLRRTGETEFTRVPPEQVMIGNLTPDPGGATPAWARPPDTRTYPASPTVDVELPVAVVVDPATGRLVVTAPAAGQPDVEQVRVAHAVGSPGALGGGAYDRNDFESPFEVPAGALVYLVGAARAGAPPAGTRRFADLPDALTQWAAEGANRTGYIVVTDNLVDPSAAAPTLDLVMPAGSTLTVVAAQWREPITTSSGPLGFLVRRARRALLLRRLVVRPAAGPAVGLTIDGAYADQGISVEADTLAALHIRHCTVRPTSGTAMDLKGAPAAPLTVTVQRSNCGPITADSAVGTVRLLDSILAGGPGAASLTATASDVGVERVTVFGALSVKTLTATDSILMGASVAARRQQGCVRYSFIGGPTTELPRRFRCQPELAWESRTAALQRSLTVAEVKAIALAVRPAFVDPEPDQPGYAQLTIDAPEAIRSGGEGDTEMGAWGFLGGPTRLANLNDLLTDYLPFGLAAGVLRADRSSIEAQGSNVP